MTPADIAENQCSKGMTNVEYFMNCLFCENYHNSFIRFYWGWFQRKSISPSSIERNILGVILPRICFDDIFYLIHGIGKSLVNKYAYPMACETKWRIWLGNFWTVERRNITYVPSFLGLTGCFGRCIHAINSEYVEYVPAHGFTTNYIGWENLRIISVIHCPYFWSGRSIYHQPGNVLTDGRNKVWLIGNLGMLLISLNFSGWTEIINPGRQ